jgi:catechol 2,3-dioxygenase-like lactoylglutathione lyase family enzyme
VLEALDHLVIAVKDLAAAARSYTELGFAVVTGGRHPEGSHNALISFADGAYLELLAFYEPSPAHRWWSALQQGGGLIDFCLASTDLTADAAAFRRAGVDLTDPEPGARARPDGYQLRWLLAKPKGEYRGVAPFLIHDETPRAERVPRAPAHANRVTGLATVTVATADPAAVARWYESALGAKGRPVSRPEQDAQGLRFAVGRHAVELLAPRGVAGLIAERLRTRGPGPCAATLMTAGGAKGPLDSVLSQGARLILV